MTLTPVTGVIWLADYLLPQQQPTAHLVAGELDDLLNLSTRKTTKTP